MIGSIVRIQHGTYRGQYGVVTHEHRNERTGNLISYGVRLYLYRRKRYTEKLESHPIHCQSSDMKVVKYSNIRDCDIRTRCKIAAEEISSKQIVNS